MRHSLALIISLGLAASVASAASAAPCRDTKGKFVKCPPAAVSAPVRCKDAHGKFAKCGTPGAHPVK
jgi:hypothetical protein